jgi:hypothetical protein
MQRNKQDRARPFSHQEKLRMYDLNAMYSTGELRSMLPVEDDPRRQLVIQHVIEHKERTSRNGG